MCVCVCEEGREEKEREKGEQGCWCCVGGLMGYGVLEFMKVLV